MENKISIKEQVLKGKNYTKKIFIKEFGGEIEIRPLTEEEWTVISARAISATKIDFTPKMNKNGEIDKEKTIETIKYNFDLELLQKADFEKNILTCKYGIVEEGLTEQELRQISPPGVIEKIANEIYKISGVGEEQLKALQFFRK
ncbi:MAG: hypothetical protein WDA59_00555 [Methanofastidiosum sp.]|jgi:hypothetical protein